MSSPTPAASTQPAISEPGLKTSRTIGYFAGFVVLGLMVASLGPTLPGLAENTQVRLSEISFLFIARSLGHVLGSLQGGRLYDRVPGHILLGAVLVAMAVLMALVPLVPHMWLLTAALLMMGVAAGALDVGNNTLLIWVHREKCGPFINAGHFFFGAGGFLAPVIIAQVVLLSGDITWAYWILALLMLPAVVWLLRLPSPAPMVVSDDGSSAQINHLLVALVTLFLFLYVGIEASYGGWVYTYAVTLGLADETMAAYLTSAFWGAFTLSCLVAIPISIRVRPRYILLADLAGCGISLGLLLLFPHSALVLWLGTVGVGLSMASVFPTALSLAQRRMTITGRVTSWFFAGAGAGGMVLPWLIGQFFESVGPRVTMVAMLVDLVVALGVAVVLIRLDSPHEGR